MLIKKGVPKTLIPIAKALILGRLIHPKSERGTREWVENTSSLTLSSAEILRHVRSMPITVPLICSTDARMLWRNIGRLTEKHPRVVRLYHIEVEPGEKDKRTCKIKAASIKWTRKDKENTEAQEKQGTYLLRTNRRDWTDKKIWETYIMLGRIEKSLRDMKFHLGFRPNFHQSKDRIESHMFISVLAYHLMHFIERKLRLNGDNRNWDSIKSILKRMFQQNRHRSPYLSIYIKRF